MNEAGSIRPRDRLIKQSEQTFAISKTNKHYGHILVVDDEPLICGMLKSGLEACDYKVSVANNGLEALYFMTDHDFDMLLMDVRMPVMDGLTATQFIRKCEQGEHLALAEQQKLAQSLHSRRVGTRIPIVAVTGNIGDQKILLRAGADEYITKPFNLSTIYEVVGQFCGEPWKSPVLRSVVNR